MLISFADKCYADECFAVWSFAVWSGAGDTVVATLSICLAANTEIAEAMKIANVAAGIVVRKIGTATLSIQELNEDKRR